MSKVSGRLKRYSTSNSQQINLSFSDCTGTTAVGLSPPVQKGLEAGFGGGSIDYGSGDLCSASKAHTHTHTGHFEKFTRAGRKASSLTCEEANRIESHAYKKKG